MLTVKTNVRNTEMRDLLLYLDKYRKIRRNDHILGDSCTLCNKDYNIGEYKRELPCGHPFHKKCIDKWLLIYYEVEEYMCCPTCQLYLSD